MARQKLLILISDLSGGGTERVVSELLHRFSRTAFDMRLAVWREIFDYQVPGDIPVTVIPKHKPWHAPRVIRQTATLIDNWRPDVIFSAMYYTGMLTGTALGFCRHRPRWVCRLGSPVYRDVNGLRRRWAQWALKRADAVIGNSDEVCRSATAYLNIPEERTVCIPNPLDVDSIRRNASEPLPFARPENRAVFVHMGRLSHEKRQDLLLQSFAQMDNPDAELWILGQGPLKHRLEAMSHRLGIADRLRWLGFQPNPYPFLKAADAFVLCSGWEGMPNVLLEAIACRTPVITTDCFASAHALTGRAGTVIPNDDTDALQAAMLRVRNDRAWVDELIAGCRNYDFSLFNPDVITEQYETLFQYVL
jgi:glycosyltransferase involved in cell wall biosynthesis